MNGKATKPVLITIPHSGEQIVSEAYWLRDIKFPENIWDTDRFVDQLYAPALNENGLSAIKTNINRYVVDLNRSTDQIDADIVAGKDGLTDRGKFLKGLHWKITSTGVPLLVDPIDFKTHQTILDKYYQPFYQQIDQAIDKLGSQGFTKIYHLDLHSMPSLGREIHPDPGETRADIVLGTLDGGASEPEFIEIVSEAFIAEGFSLKLDWPYPGGYLIKYTSAKSKNVNSVMIELNRSLYMDEQSKDKNSSFDDVTQKLKNAINSILAKI